MFSTLSEWTVAALVVLAVAGAAALTGCDNDLVGWDPATMRCRTFSDGRFVGPFLADARCAGQPRPALIEPEPQG